MTPPPHLMSHPLSFITEIKPIASLCSVVRVHDMLSTLVSCLVPTYIVHTHTSLLLFWENIIDNFYFTRYFILTQMCTLVYRPGKHINNSTCAEYFSLSTAGQTSVFILQLLPVNSYSLDFWPHSCAINYRIKSFKGLFSFVSLFNPFP